MRATPVAVASISFNFTRTAINQMRATPVAVASISFTVTRTAKSKINNYSFLSFIMGTKKNLNKFN